MMELKHEEQKNDIPNPTQVQSDLAIGNVSALHSPVSSAMISFTVPPLV